MADHTEIEWTDATWNPITGCSIVSPGCTHCYAMALAGTRLKNHESRKGLTKQVNGHHVWTGEVRFNAQWLDQPLRRTRPRMIFVCAHGDLFAEGVPDEWIDQVFAVMALAPQHTFQVLTKRPERMRDYLMGFACDGARRFHISNAADRIATNFRSWRGDGRTGWDVAVAQAITGPIWPLPNVWLGVSVEDQRRADERIPILLNTPAAIRWISAEPLLGPVDLHGWCTASWEGDIRRAIPAPRIQWVVAGGESGPGARPMHPDWVRRLRDQCAAAGAPFLLKQWGEYAPALISMDDFANPKPGREGELCANSNGRLEGFPQDPGAVTVMRLLGKRRAGRLLDGVEHNAFPQPLRRAPIQAERPSRDVPRPVRSEAGGVPVSERESATLKDEADDSDSVRTEE